MATSPGRWTSSYSAAVANDARALLASTSSLGRPGFRCQLRAQASTAVRVRSGPDLVSTTATGKLLRSASWRARWRLTPRISAISA